MRPIKIHAEEAIRTLETHKVLRTDELMTILGCSPRTLYLKLGKCQYISSINQSRRYFTLATTPKYDSNGLWEHKGAIFSKWGGIQETLVYLINTSKMGLTPSQMSKLLKTTVTPQLLACLKEKKVIRVRFGRNQIYFSSNRSKQKLQIEKRRKHTSAPLSDARKDTISPQLTSFDIENVHFGYLAQLLLDETLTADDIYIMLEGMGKSIERNEIREIIMRHKLDEKKIQLQLVL